MLSNVFFPLRLARVKSIIVFDIISTKSSSSVSFLPYRSFTYGSPMSRSFASVCRSNGTAGALDRGDIRDEEMGD